MRQSNTERKIHFHYRIIIKSNVNSPGQHHEVVVKKTPSIQHDPLRIYSVYRFQIYLLGFILTQFCLGFANYHSQTNNLQNVHTLHCSLYTVHYVPYRPELNAKETSKGVDLL